MQIWIFDKQLLNTSAITNIITNNDKNKKWKQSYVPFAGTNDDGLLIIDTSKKNCVYEWNESDGIDPDQECLSGSLGQFIETYRNTLLNGNCEYIEDVGVVEKIASKPIVNRK